MGLFLEEMLRPNSGYSSSSSCLSSCQFQRKVGINNNLTTDLCNGTIDFTTLLYTVSCRQTTPEEACNACQPIHISLFFFGGRNFCSSPLVNILPCCARKSNSSPVICQTGLPNNSFIVIIRLF